MFSVKAEPEEVDFLEEETSYTADLSFDFASGILDGAFGQAVNTWEQQEQEESDDEEDLEELRRQTMSTLSKAVQSGRLEAALTAVRAKKQEAEMDQLKEKARGALLQAQQKLIKKMDDMHMLKDKARGALLQAALTAKANAEAKELNELKNKVRDTLCQAAKSGRLAPTLEEIAPRKSELDVFKETVCTTLTEAVQSGLLARTLNELRASKIEEIPASASSAPALPAAIVEEAPPTPSMPATPTRSRRRIIGGIVRAPAPDAEWDTFNLPSASPSFESDTSTKKRQSKSDRKSIKEAARPLCIDLDMESLSKSSSRFRAAAAPSAMSMDLGMGEGFGSSSASRSMTPSSRPFSAAFTPAALNMDSKMRTSFSLPLLTPSKVQKAGLLPSLNAGKRNVNSETIAWSMQMSKTASRWGNTGLRGSASMVF